MSNPFAQKYHRDGRKLTRRVHGFKIDLDGTSNAQAVIFSVPYTACLMTSTSIISSVEGDKFDFKVLDTLAGTVSGVPNYPLNQFGFGVYAASSCYKEASEYDAELFQGLQIEVTVTPVDTVARSIYFNITLHELTDS